MLLFSVLNWTYSEHIVIFLTIYTCQGIGRSVNDVENILGRRNKWIWICIEYKIIRTENNNNNNLDIIWIGAA